MKFDNFFIFKPRSHLIVTRLSKRSMKKPEKNDKVSHYRSFDRTNLFDTRGHQIKCIQESNISMKKGAKKDKFIIRLDQPETLAKHMTEEWFICEHKSLPPWLQDNHYLIHGHRPPMPSISACFRSMFSMHTETFNIWTHVIGCIMFIIIGINFYATKNLNEVLVFLPFFIGVILCFAFSSTFHILNCYSENVAKWTNQLDYCGVSLLIVGSLTPWIYWRFQCYPHVRVFYLSTTSTLGILTIGISLSKLTGPRYRYLRVIVYTIFALSGFVPVLHMLYLQDWKITIGLGTPYFFTAAALYFMAAVLYTLRIPESLKPGLFDIWFHSHQIFHVLAVVAALVDYQGLTGVYKETVNVTCP